MNTPKLSNVGIVNVTFGENVEIKMPCNIYGCEIGERVKIGPFVEIQANSKIGAETKIQSHSFICELVVIGENCFIGHGVTFINDLFKDGFPSKGIEKNGRKQSLETMFT